jgi:hypothetical protein
MRTKQRFNDLIKASRVSRKRRQLTLQNHVGKLP